MTIKKVYLIDGIEQITGNLMTGNLKGIISKNLVFYHLVDEVVFIRALSIIG